MFLYNQCVKYCGILAALKNGCCLFRNWPTDGAKPLMGLERGFQANRGLGVLPKISYQYRDPRCVCNRYSFSTVLEEVLPPCFKATVRLNSANGTDH
jgi:hypothetical protein